MEQPPSASGPTPPDSTLDSTALSPTAATGTGGTEGRFHDRLLAALSADPEVPALIGRYKILRVLGEGGMGTVYEAEQEQPRRTVALKVIRPGYMSDRSLRRFEHESQVLGRLQHPGIAQVYEAGAVHADTEFPMPFFAMEFIRGTSLTRYAHDRHLGTRERLDLLARVADAVYHAHQKGVIHRDLKPGNILVDESGQPKVLDFGVARATDSDIQQTTLQSDVGQLIGTIPYMSPEQASGDPGELDTRSDVYALGVIAYELLAGRLPYDISKRPIHEAARIIREEAPTRLSSISRTLRGDIETIVARALEKDKSRRYQSADALAADIRRYLKHEPIAARPASTWYQARKFAKRNKGLVSGVAAAFAVLAVGLVVSLYAFAQAGHERDQKGKALVLATENEQKARDEAVAATKARDEADAARRQAEAINDFVTQSLQSSDPNEGGAQSMTVAEAMSQALANLDGGDLQDQPATVAALLGTIAVILNGNGKSAEAEAPAERALKLNRELHPGDHSDIAESLTTAANVRQSLGRAAEAEPLCVQALEMNQRLYKGDHPAVAGSLNNLAAVREWLGRPVEAEVLYVQALEMHERLYEGDHPAVATSLSNLAYVHQALDRGAEAEPLCVRALEMRQRLFNGDHPDIATSLNNLADIREALGRPAEAEPLYEQALEMTRRLFNGDHPDVALSLNNLAYVRQSLGRAADAEPLYVQSLAMYRRLFDGDHPDVARGLNNVSYVRVALDRLAEAEPPCAESLAMYRRLFDGDHLAVADGLNNLAEVRRRLGRAADAELLYLEALEMRRRLFKGDHPSVASCMRNYAYGLVALDRLPEAVALAQGAAEMAARTLPEGHPLRKKSNDTLAEIMKQIEDRAGNPDAP